jgi:D-galacturonate reductase
MIRSFEMFIDAVRRIKAGEATIYDYETKLATLGGTYRTTAILEAGRRSLDCGGNPFHILYDDPLNSFRPTNIIRQ